MKLTQTPHTVPGADANDHASNSGGGEPDSAWVRTLTHTYYYYFGNEVSVVVEKADNGTILDWSHNVYAVGRKICSASRGDIISGTLTKNFIVTDHQGNVRNVLNYDAQQSRDVLSSYVVVLLFFVYHDLEHCALITDRRENQELSSQFI